MSPGKKARNVGTPLDPFGEAKTWLAVWDWRAPVSVPEVVTGLPDTAKTEEGRARPTEETPPPPPPEPWIVTFVTFVRRPKLSTVICGTWEVSP
jgi:hypothetical protein